MSKTKSTDTPHYELLYIIPNQYTEDEVKPIVEKVNGIITNQGGAITYSEDWGKKKMAYPIKGNTFGYYHLVEFNVKGDKILPLSRTLTMDAQILRYQIVNRPPRSEAQIKAEKKLQEKRLEQEVIKEKMASEPEKEKEKAKPKMDLKDLDEKLDKILDTDDLL